MFDRGAMTINISIHVPAWGTTGKTAEIRPQEYHFNPRSRVGNDSVPGSVPGGRKLISIHVPAWGTTFLKGEYRYGSKNFNPRSRVGNDTVDGDVRVTIVDFNPRSRVGNDRVNGIL